MSQFSVQVRKDHYDSCKYDTLLRFISYYEQIHLSRNLQPQSILEVGIGNGTVNTYLQHHGWSVKTCDFDAALEPDYTADIRDLSEIHEQFDLVLACEILEQIPWEDVPKAVRELLRISRRHVIISVPYPTASFECILRFPLIRKFLKKDILRLFYRLPVTLPKVQKGGEHYWELGRMGTRLRDLRNILKQQSTILKEVRPPLDAYHYFFVLEKLQENG